MIRMQGSSNQPWLIRQTGPMNSGVTMNSGVPANNLSNESPFSVAKGPWAPSSVPFPPSKFDVAAHLAGAPTAHMASARQPGGPVRPCPYDLEMIMFCTFLSNKLKWSVSVEPVADIPAFLGRIWPRVTWHTHLGDQRRLWLSAPPTPSFDASSPAHDAIAPAADEALLTSHTTYATVGI